MPLPTSPNSPLATHTFPRLYVRPAQLAQLKSPPATPLLQRAAAAVANLATDFVTSPVVDFDLNIHNSLLIRARRMQVRLVTLLVHWMITGERRFLDAAFAHVQEMERWEYWSWHAWRKGDTAPDADFCLSCGENCATLAIAYDWMATSLEPQQRQWFLQLARRRGLQPFLRHARKDSRAWWFGKPDSNWNTVCAGGVGMLALALHDEAPEMAEVLELVEESIVPYVRSLETTGGGWPEGVGYWNYGMRYLFMYLLSHEHATGHRHPLMELPATQQTLRFPLDFCPHGCSSSFGDINHWTPLPFHSLAAQRFGDKATLAQLDHLMSRIDLQAPTTWPDAAELLLLYPGPQPAIAPSERHVLRHYPDLDWCILADTMPSPRMYLSIRGGTTNVPHSHLDLMSFHCVVGDEMMLSNVGNLEYLETTFSSRRYELFETTPPSKNTLLINGVGITLDSTVHTRCIHAGDLRCVRIDATSALGQSRKSDTSTVLFGGRLFIMIPDRAFLIIDRIELPHPGRAENRMHTRAQVQRLDDAALLTGQRQSLRIVYACSVPATLTTAQDAPTVPEDAAPTLLRWCTKDRTHHQITMATLLVPGNHPAKLSLAEDTQVILVSLEIGDWSRQLHIAKRLDEVR